MFGTVPMRVRRFQACGCCSDGPKTVPSLVTRKAAIAPELRYLTAKLAALMPFRTVAAVLNEGVAARVEGPREYRSPSHVTRGQTAAPLPTRTAARADDLW
jgi:hypothetical protein